MKPAVPMRPTPPTISSIGKNGKFFLGLSAEASGFEDASWFLSPKTKLSAEGPASLFSPRTIVEGLAVCIGFGVGVFVGAGVGALVEVGTGVGDAVDEGVGVSVGLGAGEGEETAIVAIRES